jgi:hypothetical protein
MVYRGARIFNLISRINNFHLTENNIFFAGGTNRVLRKQDNVWSITIFDSSTTIGYLINIFSDDSVNIFAFDNTHLRMSTDNGNSWIMQDSALYNTNFWVRHMIFNDKIMVGGGPINEFLPGWGILLSDDYGQTWRYTHEGLPIKIGGTGPFAKFGNDTYSGSYAAGVFKSTDFGESWFAVNNGLNAAITSDICFDNEGTIYSANWSNGFQRSTDEGKSWEVINNGLSNLYCLSIIADDNDVLIGGTDNGIYRSTNKGDDWTLVSPAGNNFCYTLYKDTLNRIYAQTYGSGYTEQQILERAGKVLNNFQAAIHLVL